MYIKGVKAILRIIILSICACFCTPALKTRPVLQSLCSTVQHRPAPNITISAAPTVVSMDYKGLCFVSTLANNLFFTFSVHLLIIHSVF